MSGSQVGAPSEFRRVLNWLRPHAPRLILVALLTGIVFGIVPAWQAAAGGVNQDLAEGGGRGSAGPRASRTRDGRTASDRAVVAGGTQHAVTGLVRTEHRAVVPGCVV